MTVQILPEDLDKALEYPWSTQTCILAQTAIRCGLKLNDGSPAASLVMGNSKEAKTAAAIFDQEYGLHNRKRDGSPRLNWLRESLPITVNIVPPIAIGKP